MPWFFACEAPKTSYRYLLCFFVPKTFKNWLTPPNWRLLGPVRITAIINNSSDSKRLSLDCFFVSYFFFEMLVWWCIFAPIRFYKQTTLRTEAFTQSSFYTQIRLHREVCAQRNFCTQTPLHRGFHAKKLLRTGVFAHLCFTRRCFCTAQHLRTDGFTTLLHTAAFTHTEAFKQRNLCTEQLLRKEFPPTKKGKQVFEVGETAVT